MDNRNTLDGDIMEAAAILKLLADGEDVSDQRDDARRLCKALAKTWFARPAPEASTPAPGPADLLGALHIAHSALQAIEGTLSLARPPAQSPSPRRPPFDGADIMRLNRLAKKFPQYESSERWKRLQPLIDWAIEGSDAPRKKGGPEAPETADLEKIQAEDESRYVSASRHYPGQAQLEGHFPPSVLRRIVAALEAAPASVRPPAETVLGHLPHLLHRLHPGWTIDSVVILMPAAPGAVFPGYPLIHCHAGGDAAQVIQMDKAHGKGAEGLGGDSRPLGEDHGLPSPGS